MSGFDKVKKMSPIISGQSNERTVDNLVFDEIMAFKRAPITHCANVFQGIIYIN